MPKEENILKKARKNLKLTQTQVGDIIGIKQEHYCYYENKQLNPKMERIIEIANALKLDQQEVYDFFKKKK